jgi:hypothetical protein
VRFVGYLYIMDLINAQKKEHIKIKICTSSLSTKGNNESSDTDNVYQYSKYFEVKLNKFNKIYILARE